MNTQNASPPLTAMWQLIKPTLRSLITPSKRFYPNISRDEMQKIRGLHITFWVLGITILVVSLPLFKTNSSEEVTRNLVMPCFWLSAIIGYILSWRGMWRVAMHSVYLVQFGVLTSFALYLGARGGFQLYYLTFTVIWASYFVGWRLWLTLMAAQVSIIMIYINFHFGEVPYVTPNLLIFSVATSTMLILSRVYRQYTANHFSHQMDLQTENLRATIEASSDAYYLLKATYNDVDEVHDFRIIEINRAACEQMAMTRAELVGNLICELFPVNRTSGFFEQYKEVFLTGERMEQEYYIPEGKPGSGWYFHQVTKIRDGVVILNRNITPTKQIELELVKRQNRLESLIESQSAYLVRTDVDGKYTYANHRFADDCGFTPETVIGVYSLQTIHPDDHLKTIETVEKCFQSPGQPIPVTLRKIHKSGKIRWTDWEFTAIGDDINTVTEIQCVGLDATLRIEAEKMQREAEELRLELQQQEEMNQIKTRMMTRISHEFRTPLSIIRSSTNLLERYHDKMDAERRNEKIQHINTEVDRLVTMVSDMGRILQGDIAKEITLTDCDIPALLMATIQRYQAVDDKNHDIITDIQPNFPSVKADDSLMDIILINLISNAIKYSPANSPVTIHLTYTEHHFSMAVVDKGIGILPDELANIYEPFFRGTNFDEVGGMGLGLSLVKNAVHAQLGNISVISKVGAGSTFTVTIPR